MRGLWFPIRNQRVTASQTDRVWLAIFAGSIRRGASWMFRRVARAEASAIGDFRQYREPRVCISKELENRPKIKGSTYSAIQAAACNDD
jgi:hypothetical protein